MPEPRESSTPESLGPAAESGPPNTPDASGRGLGPSLSEDREFPRMPNAPEVATPPDEGARDEGRLLRERGPGDGDSPQEVDWLLEDPLGRNWAPLLRSSRGRTSRRLLFARIWRWARWIVVLPLLYFLVLFVLTSLPRLNYPFELEWFEGHLALQAQRVVEGKAQYPPLGQGWATYGYPPVYFWVVSIFFRLFGFGMVWGRLVSFISAFLAASGTYLLVYDRTRKRLPAVVGGLLLFAYFKPTGYWFDLFRVDMLAQAFLAWGAYFTLKRRRRPWQLILGLLFLVLAPLTKQTVAPVSVVVVLLILLQYWRVTPYIFLLGLVLVFNGAALVSAVPSQAKERWVWVYQYLVANPRNHTFYWNRVDPDNLSPGKRLLHMVGSPLAGPMEYVRKFRAKPPEVWDKFCKLLVVPAGLTFLWVVGTLLRFKRLRGGLWLLLAALLVNGSLASWVMYGGFENNYIPAFWVAGVLVGLSYGGILHLLPRRWMRGTFDVFVLALLVVQYFPWILHNAPPWSGPFGYLPSSQQPAAGSVEKGKELVRWIADQPARVYVPHQVYLSFLAGKERFYDIDAVRDLNVCGIPPPSDLLERLNSGYYKYVILDGDLQWEWLPGEMISILRRKYEKAGPILPNYRETQLLPVTGALMKPRYLFKWKG